MNELEARRQLLADPRRLSAELRAAIEADPKLSALRDELLRRDAQLHRVLTEPAVPEGLADRIVLNARFGTRSRRLGLSLAAAVAAIAVGVPSYLRLHDNRLELARDQAILQHVVEGTDELADNRGVAPAVLRASVAKLGVEVRDPPGYRIRHLANCVIAGIESRHFVIEGPDGIVSYVILPGAHGGADERVLERSGMRALFARHGDVTVAVLGAESMDRGELEKMMRKVLA